MILVTGAAGKTGRAVIHALAARGEVVRALIKQDSQAAAVEAAGAAEWTSGSLLDRRTLDTAVAGVRAIYHICPNMHPDEVAIGDAIIAAAQNAGVEQLVYHSVLHPQTETMPHHWNKLRVEERLLAAQLPFTILQPAVYMQNVLANWQAIVTAGVYRVPYPVSTRLSYVDISDVAAAAAVVMTEGGHTNATYELVGTPPLSQTEVAEIFSKVLDRPVTAQEMPISAWERDAAAAGISGFALNTLKQMFDYYREFGLAGNTNVLRWLLGRAPCSFEDFVLTLPQQP